MKNVAMNRSFGTDAIVYHIYPFGLCNALYENDFESSCESKIGRIVEMFDGLKKLGVDTIYIGPVFESTFHGYDVSDYYKIDRRLGTEKHMKEFSKKAHKMGFKIVFDAVFNHTGRDFFAFKDLQKNGRKSKFLDWYEGLTFDRNSSLGDDFDYESWQGCKNLVKLNLENCDVQKYLFGAVDRWISDYKIDGIRLDAAHFMSMNFLERLSSFCKSKKKNFWLMGEVVHGNYNDWARKNCLDSVTNYQIAEQFWKCFNEKDFFILINELERQFGKNGIYKNITLYNFVDNHDVNRVATNLSDNSFLIPLYLILFTIPGIPSIYYGSEFCLKGKRTETNDLELRPPLPPFIDSIPEFAHPTFNPNLMLSFLSKISKIRRESEALKNGDFKTICANKTFFCFERFWGNEEVFVIINIGENDENLDFCELLGGKASFTELFSDEQFLNVGRFVCPPRSACLMRRIY